MSERSISRLWTLTGLAALVLLLATIALAVRADELSDTGYTATLSGTGGPVLVREGPGGLDPIVSILPRGTQVRVIGAEEAEGRSWVLVETEDLQGWVALEAVEVDSPGSQGDS